LGGLISLARAGFGHGPNPCVVFARPGPSYYVNIRC